MPTPLHPLDAERRGLRGAAGEARDARPLDFVTSLKGKLGLVIVGTVLGSILVLAVGRWLGVPLLPRLVATVLFGLAVAQFLAHGMIAPLREMATAATAMARGDLSRRVQDTSRDEVGDLARAFNAMASDLAEVDRQRRDLVANVSHELRTPVGALRVLLENLVDGVDRADPEQLATALAQTERLGRLVEQLLDLSRLEAGGIVMRREPFAVRELLDQAARESLLGEVAAARGVAVDWTVEPDELRGTGDVERLHQVIANLLDNAIRHSPSDGVVRLVARQAPGAAGGVTVEVLDDGPGIPDDELLRVFERFHRTDPSRAADRGGSGLGLAIARWIVEAHHGTIRAERGQPRGCRMVVELPR